MSLLSTTVDVAIDGDAELVASNLAVGAGFPARESRVYLTNVSGSSLYIGHVGVTAATGLVILDDASKEVVLLPGEELYAYSLLGGDLQVLVNGQ